MHAPPSESDATALALPDLKALDRILAIIVGLAFLVLFLAPNRLFLVPFSTGSEYLSFTPPNVVDLLWLGVGVALFARCGRVSGRAIVLLAVLLAVGAIGLLLNGEAGNDQLADLLLFNVRSAGALAIGGMLVRSGFGAENLALTYLGGAAMLAVASAALVFGIVSYDFYSEIRRFGSLGITPNESAIVLAGAFNMLPWIARERRWPALLAPLLYFGVLLTGSRTGLVLMMVGVGFWAPVLLRSVRGIRGFVAWLAIMIVVGASSWWIQSLTQQLLAQGAVADTAQRALNTGADVSTTFRVTIYLDTLAYLWDHPAAFLFGVGGSNVAVEWLLGQVLPLGTEHTHDLALQALTAYGVIGPVVCGVLLWPLLRRPARFPDLGSRGLRAFVLTVVTGQVIQYGLLEEKFQLLFFIALGYVAMVSRPSVPRPTVEALSAASQEPGRS